jgi:hypothetical protein
MAGLGTVTERGALFLSIAGGFIWNRKAEEDDANYATQEFTRADKTIGIRAGARYADLTGKLVKVDFRTHSEYGESINVTVDAESSRYILSISTNNRYSQDLMKVLLMMDLEKDLFIKPYDFVGQDKKRAMGISFRQDGVKLVLRNEDAPSKEGEWFGSASKKDIKRFFEDLNDWYVAEVTEKIVPKFKDELPELEEPVKVATKPAKKEVATPTEEKENFPDEPTKVAISPIKMKKALKEYIAENYEGKELPTLSKEEIITWYNLSLATEDLPFAKEEVGGKVSDDELDDQLNALMG